MAIINSINDSINTIQLCELESNIMLGEIGPFEGYMLRLNQSIEELSSAIFLGNNLDNNIEGLIPKLQKHIKQEIMEKKPIMIPYVAGEFYVFQDIDKFKEGIDSLISSAQDYEKFMLIPFRENGDLDILIVDERINRNRSVYHLKAIDRLSYSYIVTNITSESEEKIGYS